MTWLLYGASGYTGELAAREAVARGHRPVLAGRDRDKIQRLASELELPSRVFSLDDPTAVRAGVLGCSAVLHCAGPFSLTSAPMVAACLDAKVHYLDITGEITVFEAVFARHTAAQATGVVLLPGVGFDVVPSDAVAGRLAAALPEASSLVLAFGTLGGSWSRGTLATAIEGLGTGGSAGAIRENGRLVPVPLAWQTRTVEFSPPFGARQCATIPWGDLSTAWRSTQIPNLRVYTAMSPRQVARLRRFRPFGSLLKWRPLRRGLQHLVRQKVTGPSAEMRSTARTFLWGEALDAAGRRATTRLETPEAYAFTATAAIASLERVLAGGVEPGAWTPSQAFGAHFVDELPGVVAHRVEIVEPPRS